MFIFQLLVCAFSHVMKRTGYKYLLPDSGISKVSGLQRVLSNFENLTALMTSCHAVVY